MKSRIVFLLSMQLLFGLIIGKLGAAQAASDTTIFERVETEASFPGGEIAWRKFLERTLNGQVASDNGAPLGAFTVIVQFVVERDGRIGGITPLTKHGYGMEAEVVKVIRNGPSWLPAMMNGAPVRAYRKQPVTFLVTGEGFDINSADPYVLHIGTDNKVTINVDKVKTKSLEVTISQGTIVYQDGDIFIARVNKPGNAIIEVYNKWGKKLIGSAYFTVK